MQWAAPSLILSAGRYGEHHAIIDVLTAEHGRWRGLVRGGKGRRLSGLLQPGNEIEMAWRARLESQLGTVTVEPRHSRAGSLMDDPARLSALVSLCATLAACLPEREAHPGVYRAAIAFLDLLEDQRITEIAWGAALVQVEMGLLADLGYGLDLSACAVSGAVDDLIYVSPKSGRAVSADAGAPWQHRLLPLPGFLLARPNLREARDALPKSAIADGLKLTGFFLERLVSDCHARPLPGERLRVLQRFLG
ncbi:MULTISPECIES: DNA repair protein RecO [unclassified Iodidimonas]|jgi:DNA repair protein RecO (recombination protein O)|uniref:DNA repair protein RecO n=1 Tax=unclassified Iodidimonas TaxID=2626145 RepID=UPI0024831D9C|nr:MULTISPECIES: DNA repair protein RecO [unclassified Iodidimonas]